MRNPASFELSRDKKTKPIIKAEFRKQQTEVSRKNAKQSQLERQKTEFRRQKTEKKHKYCNSILIN